MSFKKDIDKFSKALVKGLRGATRRRDLDAIAKFIAALIRNRTRKGLGVKTFGGITEPLEPLRPSTVASRKRFKGLSTFTTPGKSNLTLTGQTLAALRGRAVAMGGITVNFRGNRRSGGRSNQSIADIINENRPFMNLSEMEFEKVAEAFNRTLSAAVKRELSRL